MPLRSLRRLRAVDALVILFLWFLAGLHAWTAGPTAGALLFGVNNLLLTGLIVAMAAAAEREPPLPAAGLFRAIRDFYPVVMIFVVFKQVHVVIQSMERTDWDPLFIAADRWLFGGDPTVWMGQFSHPVLTELLQVSYASYYFMMIALGVELRRREDPDAFRFVVFTITLGFFLSYLGYILFPGVGPRFTLHDFGALDAELPGLALTQFLRDAINAGESIPRGAANPLALAQRDIFPSGHTQMTLLTLWFAWKHRIRSRHVITVLGILLIVATVYLRYHYVVDLVGGAVFMALTLFLAPRLSAAWEARRAR